LLADKGEAYPRPSVGQRAGGWGFDTSGPPNAFHGTESFTITGGTGRFANASGPLTTEIHGQYLVFLDPSGGSFGWLEDE
jgi:hypothetical protein